MDKKKKLSIWLIICWLLAIVQIVADGVAIYEVCVLNMLPTKYLTCGIVIVASILVIVICLILMPKIRKRWMYFRRTLANIISVASIVVAVMISFYVGNLNHTVSAISSNTKASNIVGVYALKEMDADDLQSATNCSFAYTKEFDYENTSTTIDGMEAELGTSVNKTEYKSVTDMVDALYREETDCIILNKAYEPILEDQEKYEKFGSKTKLIYEYEIVEEEPETETEDTEVKDEVASIANTPFMVYISGSDTRSLTLQTSRSDVNLLAVVNPTTKQVLLLNTPRDYYIETTQGYGQYDKLTHCGIYGIDCSMATLAKLYGQEIKYYTQINFEGFSGLIDALGGVGINNEKSFVSNDGLYYNPGDIYLDGKHALSYVRERKAFADGDNQRGRNQMKVVKALIAKVKKSDTILNNYTDILSSLEGMFVTNITTSEMSDLVKMQIEDMGDWNVQSYSVTGTGASRTTYTVPSKRAYVTIPDEGSVQKARELIQKIYDGGVILDYELEYTPGQ